MIGEPNPWESAAPVSTRIGAALVVTLPRELDDAALAAMRHEVLAKVQQSGLQAIIFEASGTDILDRIEFDLLADLARSAAWLGVRSMLVGLAPGVVTYLVMQGIDATPFEPYRQLDEALATLA
jgi:anti-anti-sigma regulatory factor